jgi:hypothetical protein
MDKTKTHQQTQELFRIVVRTSKKDSMFLYFVLESNEGTAFYSTLEESLGTTYRDIEITCSIEFKSNLIKLLEHIKNEITYEVLLEEIIIDSL